MSYVFAEPSEVQAAVREFSIAGKLPNRGLNSNEAKQWRAAAKDAARALNKRAADAGRDLSGEELKEFNELCSFAQAQTERIERFAAATAGDGPRGGTLFAPGPSAVSEPEVFGWPSNERQQARGSSVATTLRAVLAQATPEQREEFQAFAKYLRNGDMMALANFSPSSDGGVLIPEFVAGALERNYAQFAPVVSVARLFPTDTGADTKFPVLSDSESGEQLDAAADTGADATVSGDTPPTSLTGPTMHSYKVSSKPVFLPRETFTDSDLDIIGEVIGALLARIIRFENLRYTRGTGSGQAQGFLTACSMYEGHDTLDLDVALDLAYSVPALYRPNGVYMCSDSTAKYLRKLKTGISGDKRQLWADADATKGTPATLHGYPVVVNNDMTDVNADGSFTGGVNSPLAFGDFKRFLIRQAENNRPYPYRYLVPAQDGTAVILFRRSDSRVLVSTAIAALNPSGS